MIEHLDLGMVNWARAQFALTAMYHWLFVPLTLGITWIIAFYHTIYVTTGNEEWKRLTKFWMKLFGINFAIGVATGIIMEFEFGTNWSNYSWMVGDIFGAPLAIEGIFAFFLEATFFAVMFFGWNRVSKGFHLFSTWMVAVGSNLSAVWILVANAWMQYPVGQAFNPDTARFEMQNFFEVAFSPYAINKFTHATSSSMLMAAFFIISISSWYLLRGRHVLMAKRSIVVAASLGLIASVFTVFNGDESAYEIAQVQPMKLAAFEGLYEGQTNAGLVAIGLINRDKKVWDVQEPFIGFNLHIPGLLSLMANRSFGSFVPGMKDLVYGNAEHNILGAAQKMERGKKAVASLDAYKQAQKAGDAAAAATHLATFNEYKEFLGYGYLNKPEDAVPPVALSFNAFHVMVILGSLFPLIFFAYLYFSYKGTLTDKKWLLGVGTITYLLGMIASQAGWIVAEVGRQPWAIQDLLPVTIARTNLTAGTVQTTFFMFLALFTLLLIAEISIMVKQINIGPEEN
ncbi:cytochrome bd quinol oxidase subunit 1 apoprotein [Desulfobulbus propionicus DSM 2032]|jgi:cytochrome d ubiquinol oxidase subunit I|uniref:Cytochrome bd quinol oxidase subunit 1 apoprotein n=1 Tax=Desulfobulbus propionicus (strain ATCC 33891 / DSM 2032 / VKM B-1956 / 1pr3) TaxID=577650 RepID=A0A7U3YJV7_DESPD|nr:cytochrome ubiquinol oxidase subunit I [Desulfobulbus propionicus]ADW16743.1 cytochrome bd quinol oxidase subunit 1 apoprotein [Desulfobulbus propionicus DSM 2032]